MKDRFYNPFDGSRKRSAPQPHKLKKDKEKYKSCVDISDEDFCDMWLNSMRYYFKKLKEEE